MVLALSVWPTMVLHLHEHGLRVTGTLPLPGLSVFWDSYLSPEPNFPVLPTSDVGRIVERRWSRSWSCLTFSMRRNSPSQNSRDDPCFDHRYDGCLREFLNDLEDLSTLSRP